MDELISIGKITKNQGNKGELRVAPYSDDLRRFDLLKEVILVSPDQKDKIIKTIKDLWFHKNFVILKLDGINDIGEALKYRNYEVKISKQDQLPLDEDEFYVDDLVELTAYLISGKKLGIIVEVIDTGGTDILIVKDDNKEYMIPMSKEYISEINIEDKTVIIKPVNGILDL